MKKEARGNEQLHFVYIFSFVSPLKPVEKYIFSNPCADGETFQYTTEDLGFE